MEILRELDPQGVADRSKKRLRRRSYIVPGPDFIWHLDGYDKLKPYGFSIHGCIDGFSRRLIWLEVGSTNKKPEVIAKYFITAAKQLNRVPMRIRSDDGTENSVIEAMQIALRTAQSDEFAGENSFIIGTSTANQKIECFWSQLTKDRPMWWRQFFKEMADLGYIDNGNVLIQQCLRYSFLKLIRSELEELFIRWNQHMLAKSKGSFLPHGRPDSIYFIPELYDSISYKQEVSITELDMFDDPSLSVTTGDTIKEFDEFADLVLQLKGKTSLNPPSNAQDALQLYFILIEAVEEFI